jgi:hypothetical protein
MNFLIEKMITRVVIAPAGIVYRFVRARLALLLLQKYVNSVKKNLIGSLIYHSQDKESATVFIHELPDFQQKIKKNALI